jgi:hypothetical protein
VPDKFVGYLPESKAGALSETPGMKPTALESLDGSTSKAIPADRWEAQIPGRDRSIFHLLLDVERCLRKQAREESKLAHARRRIFHGDLAR